MSFYVICYALITLQKKDENSNSIVLNCIILLCTRSQLVRHSAHVCTRLDSMIFNCKSGSSPHCDCVQSIIVEKKRKKMDAFLELKVFKNKCSTMLRMHFQPIKQCHMTI